MLLSVSYVLLVRVVMPVTCCSGAVGLSLLYVTTWMSKGKLPLSQTEPFSAFWWGWLCYKIVSEAFFSFWPHSSELLLH